MLRLRITGGDEEDRTPGLGIANAALSQLSYIPKRIDSVKLKTESFKQKRPYLYSPFSIVNFIARLRLKGSLSDRMQMQIRPRSFR